MGKKCIKCGGAWLSREYAFGCEHDFGEQPEPVVYDVKRRDGERFYVATGASRRGTGLRYDHPTREGAIAGWKAKADRLDAGRVKHAQREEEAAIEAARADVERRAQAIKLRRERGEWCRDYLGPIAAAPIPPHPIKPARASVATGGHVRVHLDGTMSVEPERKPLTPDQIVATLRKAEEMAERPRFYNSTEEFVQYLRDAYVNTEDGPLSWFIAKAIGDDK